MEKVLSHTRKVLVNDKSGNLMALLVRSDAERRNAGGKERHSAS